MPDESGIIRDYARRPGRYANVDGLREMCSRLWALAGALWTLGGAITFCLCLGNTKAVTE